MDSLPGAGAEILTDRVRRLISKGKCGAQEWLDVMHEAHKLDITTSATTGAPSVQPPRSICTTSPRLTPGHCARTVSPVISVGMVALTLAHMGGGGQWQACAYGLQTAVPDSLRGRVFAADYGLLTFSLSLSSIGAGFLADHYGVRPVAMCLAVLGLLWALIWGLSTRRLWRSPQSANAPAPASS